MLSGVLYGSSCRHDAEVGEVLDVGSHNTELGKRTLQSDVDRLRSVEVLDKLGSRKCVTALVHSVPLAIERDVAKSAKTVSILSNIVVINVLLAVYNNVSPNNKLIVTACNKTNVECCGLAIAVSHLALLRCLAIVVHLKDVTHSGVVVLKDAIVEYTLGAVVATSTGLSLGDCNADDGINLATNIYVETLRLCLARYHAEYQCQ